MNARLNRLPVLAYMAVMGLAPVLGLSLAWLGHGFPPNAVELMLYSAIPSAVFMALAREVRRRWDREREDREREGSTASGTGRRALS